MASVNKVILLGNVGRDPEARYTPNGDCIVNLSLATSERWKDKQGEQQEKTEWHRITFFGKQAEVIAEHVKKGSTLYVEGSLTTRKWTDKDGVDKYSTEVKAHQFQFVGKAPSQQDDAPAPARKPYRPPSATGPVDADDDIPF